MLPISFNASSNTTLVNSVHPLNALAPILVNTVLFEKSRDVNPTHPEKAYCSIEVSNVEFEIVKSVTLTHFSNALSPITFKLLGYPNYSAFN